MNEDNSGLARLTRREAIGRVGWTGLGIASFMIAAGRWSKLSAQMGLPAATPITPNEHFPRMAGWKTELRQLAPSVYAYIGGYVPSSSGEANLGVSNAGAIVGDDHVMAVDALGAPIHTKTFMAAAKQAAGGKSFNRLINTHHHVDHVAGNQFFLPAEIVSHPYCRQEVLKAAVTTPTSWPKREGWADGTEYRKLAPPSTTFEDKVTYYYGDTVVELRFVGPAHTWGDITVYLPQRKILFAGDVAFFNTTPWAHQGHVSKWLETCDKIMATNVEIIVPGHGPVGGKKEMAEMAEYLQLLKSEARKRYDAGMSPGKAAADIKLGKFDNWDGAERVVMNTVRLYDEFKGALTPDMDLEGTRQAILEYNAIKSGESKP